MKASELEKLATDLRLNSDARSIVLFVATRGKGKNEISNDDFRMILGQAGARRISTALRLAESTGWISRQKGGWGSPDSYEFLGSTDPAETAGTVEVTDPADLRGSVKSLCPTKRQAQGPDPAETAGSTRTREIRKRERVVGVDVVGEVGGPPFEIDKRVETELALDHWNGFRNSLVDYFRSRVETERQWGYLMTVRTWFQGSTAGPKGFFTIPPSKQALLVATAVNELLAETATQEKLNYRSSRGMTGSASTLRSKIEYHLRRGGAWDKEQTTLSIGDPDSEFPEG